MGNTSLISKDPGYVFDFFQKMTDDPLRVCPECGGKVIRVIHGGTGLIFKGSGWYVTDYGKGKSPSSSTETKPSTNSTESKKNAVDKAKKTEKDD